MGSTVAHDVAYMQRALRLAEGGRGWTSPNPMVGAVIVRDGTVVGEGYHPSVGEPHAEVFALRAAGDRAAGGTLYVTLEPCCHHGRTPPCTEAILAARIARMVVGMIDPDEHVAGQGIAVLRAAGLDVEVGLLEAEAARLNEAYVKHRQTGVPFVILKLAQTLDGRVATVTGRSRWITGEEARRHAHQLRSEADAVLVGVGTVLADDPQLTVRHVPGRQPRPIVLDSTARTSTAARLLRSGGPPAMICVTDRAPEERVTALRTAGADVVVLPATHDGRVDLLAVERMLGARNVVTLLVEGGSQIATSFLRARAVDRVTLFIAPKLMGDGLPSIGNLGVMDVDESIMLRDVTVERAGDDLVVAGYPVYR